MIDERSFLGDILYVISNYEKSSSYQMHWWNRKKLQSSRDSLKIMTDIVEYLEASPNKASYNELCTKIDFYFCNQRKLFISNDALNIVRYNLNNNICHSILNTNNKNVELQMRYIIKRLNNVKNIGVRKKAKREFSALFYAFHNLPKALISKQYKSLFGISPIDEIDALECSNYWINRIH